MGGGEGEKFPSSLPPPPFCMKPYNGIAPKKMAASLYVSKVICSKLCPIFSHKLLWTINHTRVLSKTATGCRHHDLTSCHSM